MDELRVGDYAVRACAVVLASGRALPSLSEILASHPSIHTAEGEFFRRAVWNACEKLKIQMSGVRERDLETQAKSVFGRSAAAAVKKIAKMGKSMGRRGHRITKAPRLRRGSCCTKKKRDGGP